MYYQTITLLLPPPPRPLHSRRGLYLVEVEGHVPVQGAVQPGLDEGGPLVLELVGAAAVALAHAGHAGVDGLWEGKGRGKKM